uniref:Uncharacterized protein n=1 Tax=Anguilla anguilla TaxID=7936 RepID=A0A0E9VQ89_ANGAN
MELDLLEDLQSVAVPMRNAAQKQRTACVIHLGRLKSYFRHPH